MLKIYLGRNQAFRNVLMHHLRTFSSAAAAKVKSDEKSESTAKSSSDSSSEKSEPTDKKFDYNKMDYYDIMGCSPAADQKKLKVAYLKAAKKYHPDIYDGPNKNHFQKVSEVYNVLKNERKRKEYDRKQKIYKMRDSSAFKAESQKREANGEEFTYEMFMAMRRARQKERVIREYQDPDFQEALSKVDMNRFMHDFQKRPMRSDPGELAENLCVPDMDRKMSKRDKARNKFVKDYKVRQAKATGLYNILQEEREKFLDIEEQLQYGSAKPLKDLNYHEMLDVLHKDEMAMGLIADQKSTMLKVIEDDKELEIQRTAKKEEMLTKTKNVVYPFYAVAFTFTLLVWFGQHQQQKLIKHNEKKLVQIERIMNYEY